ncbi:MAG: PqiC family protein [Verrucomicrobia bacterium]|nr:PqiC family protein [Verrucomicrobiota bacterium]
MRNASLSRFLLALQQSYPNTQWQPAPWTDRPPDVLCILDIHHWKAHADGTVELQGNWRFVERASGTVLNSGPFRNSSTWELASFASLAATKSRQLTEVSNQILLYAQ